MEIIVWCWAISLFIEEMRQVRGHSVYLRMLTQNTTTSMLHSKRQRPYVVLLSVIITPSNIFSDFETGSTICCVQAHQSSFKFLEHVLRLQNCGSQNNHDSANGRQ
jgi:hypothetical protein